MNTPIYDFIRNYAASDMLRCHMPGHKGRIIAPEIYTAPDITEISGADSLFEADGIIAESERNMSQLYGTAETAYSAGGSTLCIQAMLALMKQENRRIFAVRNVHRAFLNAAALLDLDVEWLIPHYDGGILSGKITSEDVEKELKRCNTPACLYVTSPDYTGRTADIKALAEICHRCGAKLLVDNAHGAHLAFLGENIHPIFLGADLCCDSAHKMLPALTGGAMLHCGSEEYCGRLKQAMSLFASTSPSYLIMASLDLCNRYIAENIRKDTAENEQLLKELRRSLSGIVSFADGEPFHVTIKAAESGFRGTELSDKLRENGVECEYADNEFVILLMSPLCRKADYERLVTVLERATAQCEKLSYSPSEFYLPKPKKTMSIRQAVFAPSENIPVEKAEGRICGAVKVHCPPAIPIAVSGEIITEEYINIFKRYGISDVNVVK